MATNEPLTDERYQTIQAHAEIVRGWRDTPDSYADVQIPLMAMILGADVLTLTAEVDRLRAREQALQLQLDAMSSLLLDVQRDCVAARQVANVMRPIVETVAEHIGGYVSEHFRQCAFCGNGAIESRVIAHANGCEVEQARAFVAGQPTASESAGGDDGR